LRAALAASLMALALPGCTPQALPFALPASLTGLPAMPWHSRPEAPVWTAATRMAVAAQDAALAQGVPRDVAGLCPGYEGASMEDRRSFWVAMVALTARAESGFNPAAQARGGFVGLMQIAPATARAAGCGVSTKAELADGENNLFCAVQILSGAVARDGEVLGQRGNRGIGRDWMPWRRAATRTEAASWLKRQSYCR
jgi:hypothetical protein